MHVRRAVARHVRDLETQGVEHPWRFNEGDARYVCDFIESLHHVKGALAGQRLTLEPWQCWVVCCLFGWQDAQQGLRRFRTAYIEIPRKNAKTTLAAAIGLYMLCADGENGAECYSAASGRDQASISYRTARQMVMRNDTLREVFEIKVTGGATYAGVLALPDGSLFKPLPRDTHGSLDGYSPSFALLDEIHTYQTPDVYDALRLGMGEREQPILLGITTAGYGLAGFGHMQSKLTTSMLAGDVSLPRHFGAIWTLDAEDLEEDGPGKGWRSPRAWRKANPNYGVSVRRDFLETAAAEALASADKERAFLTKNLNVWMGADSTWMNMSRFGQVQKTLTWEWLYEHARRVWIALDLSESTDLTCVAYIFDVGGVMHVKIRTYCPANLIAVNPQFVVWERDGFMEAHTGRGGAAIDQEAVMGQIRSDARLCASSGVYARSFAYDPWHVTNTMVDEVEAGLGIEAVSITQGIRNFARPMKELLGFVAARDIVVDDDPCLSWMISNVVAMRDLMGNMKPSRADEADKIDGAVAFLMALIPASVQMDEPPPLDDPFAAKPD